MKTETVLITGASSGIGWELARCFARDGSRLILISRSRGKLEKLAAELNAARRTQVEVFPMDLAEPDAAARVFRHLETHGTRVDILVNNAGIGANGPFVRIAPEWQADMIRLNVLTLTELTRLLLPRMVERKHGGLLNVASTAGFQPGPLMAVYYATKAFVLSFTEALAEELAGTGVAVTALCPGPTATNFAEASNARHARVFARAAMSAEAVAAYGHRAFRNGKLVAIPGFRNRVLAFGVRLGPRAAVRKIAGHLNRISYEKTSVG